MGSKRLPAGAKLAAKGGKAVMPANLGLDVPTIVDFTDASPDHFPAALACWAYRINRRRATNHEVDEAFRNLIEALGKTAEYLDINSTPSREKADELSELWTKASKAIVPLDREFAGSIFGLGWCSHRYWCDTKKIPLYRIDKGDIYITGSILYAAADWLKSVDTRGVFAPSHIRAANPVLIIALVFAGAFGLFCIFGGIQLMNATGSGETSFDFLGLKFTTKQAGVAAIALGAAVIILTFRKVLKTVVDLGRI
jgi:hypothetical protein